MNLLLIYLLIGTSYASNFSCETKLKNKNWPMECFLSLEINPKKDKFELYDLLNRWCELNTKELSLIDPPKALFSIKMPQNCLKIALKTKSHHKRLKIFNGSFLDALE